MSCIKSKLLVQNQRAVMSSSVIPASFAMAKKWPCFDRRLLGESNSTILPASSTIILWRRNTVRNRNLLNSVHVINAGVGRQTSCSNVKEMDVYTFIWPSIICLNRRQRMLFISDKDYIILEFHLRCECCGKPCNRLANSFLFFPAFLKMLAGIKEYAGE